MTSFFRAVFALSFGFIAFFASLIVFFAFLELDGPDNGPVFGVVASLIGIAFAAAAYPKTTLVVDILGLPQNLTKSKLGRLAVVGSALFVIFSALMISIDEDWVWLVFAPSVVAITSVVGRWILRGSLKLSNDV